MDNKNSSNNYEPNFIIRESYDEPSIPEENHSYNKEHHSGTDYNTYENYSSHNDNGNFNDEYDYYHQYSQYGYNNKYRQNGMKNFFEKFRNKNKQHKPSSPITLTKKKFIVSMVLVAVLAFGGAFSGMYLYDNIYGNGHKTSGTVSGNGYTLAGATGSSMTVDEIVNKNLDSVVQIRTESVQQDFWLSEYVTEGAGSGVIITEDGYIITNHHVIDGASNIYVTLSNNKEYSAELIGSDAESDVAVLKIDASGLSAATYGNSDELAVGDLSVIIGNPLGELGGTVTAGIISALDREITIDGQPMTLLQTDASVNPGNSGGGMFDQYGHLVGIVVAKSSGSDVEGLGFAIPITKAADIASQIMKNGSVKSTTAYSGMTYVQSQNGSVYIQSVDTEFAQKSGFRSGDQVLAVGNTIIDNIDTLSATIKSYEPGDTVTFTIARNGQQVQIKHQLQTKDTK